MGVLTLLQQTATDWVVHVTGSQIEVWARPPPPPSCSSRSCAAPGSVPRPWSLLGCMWLSLKGPLSSVRIPITGFRVQYDFVQANYVCTDPINK